MTEFRSATLTSGEKIDINLDAVRTMVRFSDMTEVYFAIDHYIRVKEEPFEIQNPHLLRKG
jgi:hypothetical protein